MCINISLFGVNFLKISVLLLSFGTCIQIPIKTRNITVTPESFPLCNFPQIKFLLVTHSLQRVNFLSLNISVLMIEVLLSVVNYLECLLYIKAFPGTGDVSLIDCLS